LILGNFNRSGSLQDLLNATDEEILLVAKDLGMNLAQRESAAFAGLKYPAKPQLADFFDFAICKKAIDKAQPIVNHSPEGVESGPIHVCRREKELFG
jgi:hypothetical protein